MAVPVEHAWKASGPSGVLKRFGPDVQDLSPEQVARRSGLAALPPPPIQAAVTIDLPRADTAMQALI